ncbi:Major facilitator superfamily [Carpediemonas membranifera]|uniref:Major facilitator superfamily n=1 Tax=Carpediemonas membranifera TaxID=201153 RepID=A0A8J6AUY9_9EUKA|nr:Major facilitator superfamily [Carpediemonas membranifera]|eukprot:KAG9394828.1 Major facilitator superfamily [Carpediemonas membranifera]
MGSDLAQFVISFSFSPNVDKQHLFRVVLALAGVFCGFFTQDLVNQLIRTIQPYYLETIVDSHYDLANSVLTSVWSLASLVSAPLLGYYADSHRPSVILMACFAVMTASSVLSAFVSTYLGLVFVNGLSGAASACFNIFQAISLNLAPPRHRSFVVSVGGLFYGMAYVVGSQLSKKIVQHYHGDIDDAWLPTCFIAAGFSLIAGTVTCALIFFGPNMHQSGKHTAGDRARSYLTVFLNYRLWLLYLVCLVLFMSLAGLPAMVPFYITDHYHLDREQSTVIFARIFTLVGLGLSVVSILVKPLQILLRRDSILMTLGTVLTWAPLMFCHVIPAWLFPWAMFMNAAGQTFAQAPMAALLGQHCAADQRALITGFNGLFQALARVFTPIFTGQLYDMTASVDRIPVWVFIIGLGVLSSLLSTVYVVVEGKPGKGPIDQDGHVSDAEAPLLPPSDDSDSGK